MATMAITICEGEALSSFQTTVLLVVLLTSL
ncbi:hypothetical protein BH23CHL4_BH23CHL4_28480 [soil metagenome]